MKPIRFSRHATERCHDRGAIEEEVIEAIRTMPWAVSETQRFECRRDFAYNADWHGKFYPHKQVRPIFVEETDEIVVVTVYVYYF